MTPTEHLRAAIAAAVAARVGVTNPDTRLLLALLDQNDRQTPGREVTK